VQPARARLRLRALPSLVRRRLAVLVASAVLVPVSALVASLSEERQYTGAVSLGVLIGVFLGVGLAIAWELIDRRTGQPADGEATHRPEQDSAANRSEEMLRGDVVRDR
jgi:hypothetical protein